VSRIDIVPFSDEHLDGAAALLAARHARHRASEPLLPEIENFLAQVERDWSGDDASGAAAIVDGELSGYVIGRRRDDQLGPHLWIDLAGHAARDAEVVRDLYAAAAGPWVEAGLTRHFVFAPLLNDLVAPWFRLGFGASAALAVRETGPDQPVDAGVAIRPGSAGDLEASARYDRLIWENNALSPSFSGLEIPSEREFVDDWRGTWDEPEFTHFVAERDGLPVGHALLYRRPAGDLRVPESSIDLANVATEPDVRGSGVGRALTAHALAWAHENGYATMITDWRMTNLLASRFWPRRGFRKTFLRLYRSIP
jgi:GNAT superfamily N-acetyltransferase